jgi:hypothetical protein
VRASFRENQISRTAARSRTLCTHRKIHADYLVSGHSAHYLLTMKGDQLVLHNQLKALPGKKSRTAHTSSGRAHGRVEHEPAA